jgi:hypothetical protein
MPSVEKNITTALNGMHQLLVYTDDVKHIELKHTHYKENNRSFISHYLGDWSRCKYCENQAIVVTYRQNAGQRHNIRTGNKSSERVEQSKYL